MFHKPISNNTFIYLLSIFSSVVERIKSSKISFTNHSTKRLFYFYFFVNCFVRLVSVCEGMWASYTPTLQSCAVVRHTNHVVSTLASWLQIRRPGLYRVARAFFRSRNISSKKKKSTIICVENV